MIPRGCKRLLCSTIASSAASASTWAAESSPKHVVTGTYTELLLLLSRLLQNPSSALTPALVSVCLLVNLLLLLIVGTRSGVILETMSKSK